MSKFKRKFDFSKNRFSGKAKEAVGKVTGNQQLELDGKIESARADIRSKLDMGETVHEIKEAIAEKVNDTIDESQDANQAN